MYESSVTKPPERPDWVPWTLSVFGVCCAVFVLWQGVLPARAKNESLAREVSRLSASLEVARGDASREREQRRAVERELARARGELDQIAARERASRDELSRARDVLEKSLRAGLQRGQLTLGQRDDELVVGVPEQWLFRTGSAAMTPTGQRLLAELGTALGQLPGHLAFQIGAHLDGRPIARHQRRLYPTGWELSTSRAAKVARFLQERAGVAGPRLAATGFAHHRPLEESSGHSRREDRRIEIAVSAGPDTRRAAADSAGRPRAQP